MRGNLHGIVSDHAALRFLERVRMVDVGERGSLSDRGWLTMVCQRMKTTCDDVKTSMLTPAVLAALAAGARRYTFQAYTYVILQGSDGNRFIGSVLTTRMHKRPQVPKKARR